MRRWLMACLAALAIPLAQAGEGGLREAHALLDAQRVRPDSAQFARAKAIVASAIQRTPDAAEAWTLQARVSLTEHRFADALDAAKRADALSPSNPRTLALMVDALVELGRYDEAVGVAQRLVERDPCLSSWVRAARLRFLHDDLDGATQLLAQAARSGRGEPGAWTWLELARMQLHAGDLMSAGQAVAAARAACPNLPAILPVQARLLLAEDRARDALAAYRQALVVQPAAEEALAAWRLARQLGSAGEIKHLAALLEGLAKLDTRGLSRRALAEYFAESGQPRQAVKLARAEFAARPDLYSHATLARVLRLAGDAAEARRHAQAALALNTPDPQLRADMRGILAAQPVQAARP